MSPTELLFILLITLFSYFPLLISKPFIPSWHICSRIMSGAFQRIHLISMTYDTDNHDATGLFIFQSGDRLYRIPLAKVHDTSIDLQDVKYTKYRDDEKIGRALNALPTFDHLQTIYAFQTKATGLPDTLAVHGVFMVTDKRRYMYITAMVANELRIGKTRVELKEFALVHTQKKNTVYASYAIHRDIYDHTGDFIIYQVALNPQSFTIHQLQYQDAPARLKNSARFYYLEKTANPSTVKFVHRRNFHNLNAENQLFEKQPVGFLHRATGAMILFDTALGCVYHFYEWNEADLWKRFENGQNFEAKRKNYPFELFFLCDQKLYPKAADFEAKHNADRCETVIGSSHSTKLQELTNTTEYSSAKKTADNQEEWFGGNTIFAALAGILLIVSVHFCICSIEYLRGKIGQRRSKVPANSASGSKTKTISKTPNLMRKTGTSPSFAGSYSKSRSLLNARSGSKSRPLTSKQNSMHRKKKMKKGRSRSSFKTT